jgi:hypothetical protein
MLRITVAELSVSSGVGLATIKRIEAHVGVPPANARTLSLLSRALTAAGIEFVGSPEDSPGVRLMKWPEGQDNLSTQETPDRLDA